MVARTQAFSSVSPFASGSLDRGSLLRGGVIARLLAAPRWRPRAHSFPQPASLPGSSQQAAARPEQLSDRSGRSRSRGCCRSRSSGRSRLGRRLLGRSLLRRSNALGVRLPALLDRLSDQFDHRHGSVVALTRTNLGDPGIAALAVGQAGCDLGEQRVHHTLVANSREHQTPGVDVTPLGLGDQLLRQRTQPLRLGLGRHDPAMFEQLSWPDWPR